MPQPRGGAQPPMAIDIDKPRQAPLSARSYPAPCKLAEAPRAQVAELVDAPASGAGARKGVEVRVLSWAPLPRAARPGDERAWRSERNEARASSDTCALPAHPPTLGHESSVQRSRHRRPARG